MTTMTAVAAARFWSADKQRVLQEMMGGFWAHERWVMADAPVRGAERIGNRHGIVITCLSPTLLAEIKYACRCKLERGDWAAGGFIQGPAIHVRRICRWLDAVAPTGRSLLERSLEHWLLSFRSYLTTQGLYVRRQSTRLDAHQHLQTLHSDDYKIGVLREIYALVLDFYDDRPEFEKDVWRADRCGLERTPGSTYRTLVFGAIPQPWLRQAIKAHIRLCATHQSLSGCEGKILHLRQFAQFLAHDSPDLHPAQLDRAIIERYIDHLAGSGLSQEGRRRRLSNLKLFLDDCIEHGWAPLPPTRFVFNSDYPGVDKPLPRFIPAPVLCQLHAHRDALPPDIGRMLLIIEECGMRISELLGLKVDCLRGPDADGDWWLFYYQYKLSKEHSIPLLTTQSAAHRAVVAAIQAQAREVMARWGDTCDWLFPNTKGRPWDREYFSGALNRLGAAKDIRDPATGQLWRFESHQFRHTLGYRLINNGVSHATIQRFFGHESPLMVQVYAHVAAETVKRELATFQRKVVNIRGEEQAGDPRLETADLQLYKKNVRGQALMIGTCGLPVYFQRCPHANACLTCTHWRIATADLPAIADLLAREERILVQARMHGNAEAIAVGDELILNLRTVIAALEQVGAMAAPTLLDEASPKDVAVRALKVRLVQAEVALAQARAQGDGSVIAQRQEGVAALKRQIAGLGGSADDA